MTIRGKTWLPHRHLCDGGGTWRHEMTECNLPRWSAWHALCFPVCVVTQPEGLCIALKAQLAVVGRDWVGRWARCPPHPPESLCLVMNRASKPSSWRVVQLGEQRHVFVLVGISCELHCNGLGGTWGFMTIETGNCLFCFRPFVKPDKRNPSGQTFLTNQQKRS